jgi:hypothetical protein
MALYKVSPGDLPMASDIDQLVDVFLGAHSIGGINLAQKFNPPVTSLGVTITNAGIDSLGVGSYTYALTFITGYKKSNGSILITNETPISNLTNVTTTDVQQQVTLSGLPALPTGVIGIRIYRTKLGAPGVYYLVTTITDPTVTSYIDKTTDANLSTSTPPSTNSTGTYFKSLVVSNDGITNFLSATSDGVVVNRLSMATTDRWFLYNALGDYGLNMNNSDIINVNSVVMRDAADGSTEGFFWAKSTTTPGSTNVVDYDRMYVLDGTLYVAGSKVRTNGNLNSINRGSTNTSLPTATYVKVDWMQATAPYMWDNTNKAWSIPRAGKWKFTATVTLQNITSGSTATYFNRWTLNNVATGIGTMKITAGGSDTLTTTYMGTFSVGDLINVEAYISIGTANVYGTWSHIIIEEIG